MKLFKEALLSDPPESFTTFFRNEFLNRLFQNDIARKILINT